MKWRANCSSTLSTSFLWIFSFVGLGRLSVFGGSELLFLSGIFSLDYVCFDIGIAVAIVLLGFLSEGIIQPSFLFVVMFLGVQYVQLYFQGVP